ncbi:MAG TPA: GAF domain-containing protein [Candidatus Methylomirabilis sp.]|nr:GAF domain-containing protein [Candidatus Methylomirabilis sp.]
MNITVPGGLILLTAMGIGLRIARGTWRPLQALTSGIRRIGSGEREVPLPVEAAGEVGEVASAFQEVLETITRRQQELGALLQANEAIGSSLDLEQILQTIVHQAAAISGAPTVRLLLLEDEGRLLRCHVGVGRPLEADRELVIPVGESFSGQVAVTGEPLAVADCRNDPRLLYPEHPKRYGLISYLGLPVKLEDQTFGVLVFNTPAPRSYTAEEIAFHAAFARQAALAIQNARLYQAEQERRGQLEAVRNLSVEITRELDLTTLLDLITRRAMELVGAGAGSIHLWDEAAAALVPHTWSTHEELMRETRIHLGEGLVGLVAQRRQGMIVNDYRTWPHARPTILGCTKVTAAMAEPLVYRDRLVGVIGLENEGAHGTFSEQHRQALALLAAQASIAIENARLYADLRRSYQTLEAAQEELVRSEKLRALGQMSAGIAHDLNNMLAAILGQVDLLRMQVTDPHLREALGILETSATDGAHVVRRLQDFARQRASTSLVPVDLARIVREVLEITRPRWKDDLERQGRIIEVRTALEGLPHVLGHHAEVREVLTNLILNAVDAMPAGGILGLTARSDGGEPAGQPTGGSGEPASPGWVELLVTDTGIGMTEAVRRRIFDPFFTTKGVQGTGLGLSVAYGIMERHGGSIQVESSPGRGAAFTLRFRVASAAPPVGSTRPGMSSPSRRILLIDDDPTVRGTVGNLLRAAGHLVEEADGGSTGLTRLAESPVDIVLTDLGMPEVTGWDVARAVKARIPGLPVILLTGWGDQPTPDGGDSDPSRLVDRVLGKPFRLEELLGMIADLTRAGRS